MVKPRRMYVVLHLIGRCAHPNQHSPYLPTPELYHLHSKLVFDQRVFLEFLRSGMYLLNRRDHFSEVLRVVDNFNGTLAVHSTSHSFVLSHVSLGPLLLPVQIFGDDSFWVVVFLHVPIERLHVILPTFVDPFEVEILLGNLCVGPILVVCEVG